MIAKKSGCGLTQLIASFFVLSSLLFFSFACRKPEAGGSVVAKALTVDVQVDKVRPKSGETVAVRVSVRSSRNQRGLKLNGSLFIPTRGATLLPLQATRETIKNEAFYEGNITLPQDAPEGLYALTVEAVRGSGKAWGKASFIRGKVVADFMIASALPDGNLEEEIRRYFEDFKSVGGNLVIIHNFITDKALYPSRICAKAAAPGTAEDKVGAALRLAGEFGLTAMLTAGWDMTRSMPYSEYPASVREIIGELWELYGASPALIGFYSYQEGSGTYLAAWMRDFAAAVKSHNRGLLTGCAPYIDDPLLAGYLAAIDDLDIVIYQGAVQASYRHDNRKIFPPRRTKDFTSLSAGATRARNKITISHVELFGYLEKQFAGRYLANPEDIRTQILSAATAFGPDGISFFTYHGCIYNRGKAVPEARQSRRAVQEAMRDYRLIAQYAASPSSRVGLYIPYSDWWSDRWTNIIVPALDAFRRLGVSPDILPFVPPPGEEILPFYPLHLNPEQLAFFQAGNYALVLTDIGGMQNTDSLLLRKFIEDGGRAILFGPRIPYSRAYDRNALCGGRENPPKRHFRIEVTQPLSGRVHRGASYSLRAVESPSWTPTSGKAIARFEDGSAAVLINQFGKGICFTIPLSLGDAVRAEPGLVRDILDEALGQDGSPRLFDVVGLDEQCDIALSGDDERRVFAVVNYKKMPIEIDILPLRLERKTKYALTDLRTGAELRTRSGQDLAHIKMSVPAIDFICLSLSVKR